VHGAQAVRRQPVHQLHYFVTPRIRLECEWQFNQPAAKACPSHRHKRVTVRYGISPASPNGTDAPSSTIRVPFANRYAGHVKSAHAKWPKRFKQAYLWAMTSPIELARLSRLSGRKAAVFQWGTSRTATTVEYPVRKLCRDDSKSCFSYFGLVFSTIQNLHLGSRN